MDNMNKKIESEIDFINALKSPLRLFGLVYFYFFSVALVIGIYFVKNIDEVSFNQIPGSAIDTLNIDRDIQYKLGGIRPAMDLKLISNPTAEFISKGKDLYQTNCASCHGTDGKGDGPAGTALNPPPRSFFETTGWKNGREFSQVYKTLQEGIPGSGMTAYEFVSPEDRVAMIQYIRSLTEFPAVTETEIESLDSQYQLTEGIIEPNNIPVKAAEKIIADEYEISTSSLENLNSGVDDLTNQLMKTYSFNRQATIRNFKLRFNDTQNLSSFIQSASADPNMFGLKTEVVNLNNNEWERLFIYLKSL